MRLAVLALTLAACVTAEKQYEKGTEAEAQGRHAAAAEKYIDALRRDPEFPNARERALENGNRAVAGWVKTANGLESAGRYEQAIGEYRKADGLIDRAAGVGVILATPSDYRTRRGEVFRRAADEALSVADRAAADGRWLDAANAYKRIGARYVLTTQQRARAREGRYRALLTGAEAETRAGRFDQADVLANEALAVYGPGSKRSSDAHAMRERVRARRYDALCVAASDHMKDGRYQDAYGLSQDAVAVYGEESDRSLVARGLAAEILRHGSLHVAPTPVWVDDRIERRVPRGLLRATSVTLANEFWSEPPLFVVTVAPEDVRRTLRDLDYGREVLTDRRAAKVGRRLGIDYTVVLYVVKCAYDAKEQPEPRVVQVRGGAQDNIDVYRRRSLSVSCAYRVVEVGRGRTVAEGRVDAAHRRPHVHAVYNGNRDDDLLLSREEHEWLDDKRLRTVDEELVADVAKKLATGISEAVYNEITKRLR